MNPIKQNESSRIQQSEEQQILSQEYEQSSQASSQDEVRQKAVFEMIEEQKLVTFKSKQNKKIKNTQTQQNQQQGQQEQDQGLNEEERQAFLYLLSVRKQKKTLLQEKKKRKAQLKRAMIHIRRDHQTEHQKNLQKEIILSQKSSLKIQDEYINCIVSNFNIVIQNAKYLIKTNPEYAYNNKKYNTKLYESVKLQSQPLIHDLMKLTIGQIQDAIRKFSLQLTLGPKHIKKEQPKELHEEIGEKQKENTNKSAIVIKYCQWIYSLLALHQAWSSYKHFESLAQINFVLQNKIKQIEKYTQKQQKSILILLILVINVFEQRHLKTQLTKVFSTLKENQSKVQQQIQKITF